MSRVSATRLPSRRAISTHSCMVTPAIGTNGTTSVAPMRGCSPSCWLRSINSAALVMPRYAASSTASGVPTKVRTVRLWSTSECRSKTRTPLTLATAAMIVSITSGRRASEKFGMHSTIFGDIASPLIAISYYTRLPVSLCEGLLTLNPIILHKDEPFGVLHV